MPTNRLPTERCRMLSLVSGRDRAELALWMRAANASFPHFHAGRGRDRRLQHGARFGGITSNRAERAECRPKEASFGDWNELGRRAEAIEQRLCSIHSLAP